MGNFFAELKRRYIYRVAAAYAVVAWVLLQLVNNVAPVLELPTWVARATILLLAIGFPVALLLAWVVEAAPASTKHGTGEVTATRPRQDKIDWVVAAAAVIVIAIFIYQQFASPPREQTVQAQQSGVSAARAAAASSNGAISIAVLPFANMSGDATQEFFSDGMTEEITSALAKVPDLRVVARTSAFGFKGKNVNIKTMGEELGATHLIEGSVRKAGNRVRITVQLIKAQDGTHIWAQDYDRELNDIFAIQEDIGRAITASLNMSLGLKPTENLVSNRKIDSESYQQYLRAKALDQAGGRQANTDATALLEQVVARNPDFAPAWALLGFSYGTTAFQTQFGPLEESRRIADVFVPKAEAAVRRAILLDPNLPDGYRYFSTIELARGKMVAAEDLMLKALALDPDNPDVLNGYSLLLGKVGRLKEAMPIRLKLRSVEPFVPLYNSRTATLLWVNGQNDAALAMFKAIPTLTTASARRIARVYATTGRLGDAADALQGIPAIAQSVTGQEAMRLLRSGPRSVSSADKLRNLDRLSWVYLYVGAPEQSLETQERMVDLGLLAADESLEFWHLDYALVRKTERFKAFARKAGLVDYWRAKGWPDLCHPTTGDDFECD